MPEYITDPRGIEQESMKIIDKLMQERSFPEGHYEIIKRIIHTTADLDFADITEISPGALEGVRRVILEGNARIITDTRMISVGLNQTLLQKAGADVECFVNTDEAREMAQKEGITRSMANIRLASSASPDGIYLIGNAPTALFELLRLCREERLQPTLVVGVPVGFVGAAESKEELRKSSLPYITTIGRKGGSTVAVAAAHALLKMFFV